MLDVTSTDYTFGTAGASLDADTAFGNPGGHTHSGEAGGLEKIALAAVAIGALFLLNAVFSGPLNGTWTGLALSFGPLCLGAAVYWWLVFRNTEPGIKHDGNFFSSVKSRGGLGWTLGIAMTALYVLLYFNPRPLGYNPDTGEVSGGLVGAVEPLARLLTGGGSSQWFLYGVVYTLAILTLGVRMAMKYRHNRYQLVRTASVSFFQLGFAFLLPNLMVAFQAPYYEFNGVWPLKSDYLWPDKVSSLLAEPGAIGTFMVFWGLAATFLATPLLTFFFGKRWYCSWVCGCGGLAETLGDPFRHLSDKGTRAWKIERFTIHAVLVLVLVVSALLWAHYGLGVNALGGAAGTTKWLYGLFIGAIFSGVAGVGFYPLLGSRVWCRFGCPMAAVLGILQRLWSRFRITTNGGQCMSCGNCSTYCEMGIDVRAYAQAGENIVRASCVGCGVCSAVCPRGVLKLENGTGYADRYDGAENPLAELMRNIREGTPEAAPPGQVPEIMRSKS